jgi:hypothetical protein
MTEPQSLYAAGQRSGESASRLATKIWKRLVVHDI